jgi:multidrug efflux pump
MRTRDGTLWALSVLALIAMAIGAPVLADCESRRPILYLAFSSSEGYQDTVTITDFADRVVGNHLRNLPGVADVAMFGDRRPVLRIRLDRSRLAAYGATPGDVAHALQRQGVELPAGDTDPINIELPVSWTSPSPWEGIESIVVRENGDAPVRLMDVAEIGPAIGGARTVAHYAGKDVVALGIVNQSDTGVLAVWFAVSRILATIRPMMPRDVQVDLVSPFSIVIERLSGD